MARRQVPNLAVPGWGTTPGAVIDACCYTGQDMAITQVFDDEASSLEGQCVYRNTSPA